jgi:hypothetical protein
MSFTVEVDPPVLAQVPREELLSNSLPTQAQQH